MRIRLNSVEVVRETVELFEGSARRAGVCIEVSAARVLPQVMADRVQVQQVLLNLLQNALDATSGSPHVSFSCQTSFVKRSAPAGPRPATLAIRPRAGAP